jgi:dienelactone hydrolase
MRFLAVCAVLLVGCANTGSEYAQYVVSPKTPTNTQIVSFPGPDGITLKGFLRLPSAEFTGKRAGIVFQHGCGGVGANGGLSARHREAMQWAAVHGYVALHVDSLTPRGLTEICTQRLSERTIKQSHRTADAYAALEYLATHSRVEPSRIALWGWSHGASSVLNAMRKSQSPKAKFAAAVAFYPGCSAFARDAASYAPVAPTHILIGAADDWTPAAPCISLAEAMRAAGKPLTISVYPNAYHGFDDPSPNARVRIRTEVPNGVHPGRGVTVGSHPEARAAARMQVATFLGRTLTPETLLR